LLRSHVSGGEDVREKQDLLIAEVVGDLQKTDIGIGTGILSLCASIFANQVRISEETAWRVAPQVLGHPSIWIGILAQLQ
jgi:hypothetical protein